MRRGIFIPLLDDQAEDLYDLADRNWRRPVDQAAKILIEGLRRERLALDPNHAAGRQPATVPA